MKPLDPADPYKGYAFCEGVHAGSASRWHVRKLGPKGLKHGGGIDTNSLCGHVKAPMGWDLETKVNARQLADACAQCKFSLQLAIDRATRK